MSTIFNIRNIKLPGGISRASVIIGTLVVILALVAGVVGWNLYRKLTTNTVVAYFPQTLALYAGDKVQIMGVRVGSIDSIEPAGDKMKVTFTYASKYKVPANVTASVLNPSLVASRTIQLAPPYTGGPELEGGAVIPIDRTQVPLIVCPPIDEAKSNRLSGNFIRHLRRAVALDHRVGHASHAARHQHPRAPFPSGPLEHGL